MSATGIRGRLANLYAATHHRYTAREPVPVSFFEELARQGPILVVMPRDPTCFEAARHVLVHLRHFTTGEDGPVRIHTFLHETFKNWIDSRLISHALAWADDDLNALRLPSNRLLNQVAGLRCDVALDLNVDDDLGAAYVVGMTGAKIRISMGPRQHRQFYNVELRVPVDLGDLRRTYLGLTRQLHQTFFPSEGEAPTELSTL
ncbi:MAG: hypothetical protein Q8O14_07070 [bacterium]|jgi:hypothetical protein|nr:hypothetical protein [bacterium]